MDAHANKYPPSMDHLQNYIELNWTESNRVLLFMFSVWMVSFSMGTSLFLSPIWVSICTRRSTRLTAVFGGLVTSLACLFTSFASQFHQTFISFGIILSECTIFLVVLSVESRKISFSIYMFYVHSYIVPKNYSFLIIYLREIYVAALLSLWLIMEMCPFKMFDNVFFVGIGIGLSRDASYLMVGQYFKRRRYFVEVFLVAASGLGILVMTLIVHSAIRFVEYGEYMLNLYTCILFKLAYIYGYTIFSDNVWSSSTIGVF